MEHLHMHSLNKINENISKIAALFPNCVTEAKDDNGEIVHKIDFDMLKQELSSTLVEGREERYQFTWPDKKQAILTANAPINKTLRPCREESVDFDNTENLYIEGDNLEALKLLQETYLGKIKMIYIDPPYNTGNDFVYEDDFAQDAADYIANSGQTDEEGNRLVANTESNGRFHTDWLNMMYPRLKLARDFLSDDGVILFSIGDKELRNSQFLLDELFGATNQVCIFTWKSRSKPTNAGNSKYRPQKVSEYILVYSKQNPDNLFFNVIPSKERSYPHEDKDGKFRTTTILTSNRGTFRRETMRFESHGFTPDSDFRWKAGKTTIDNLYETNHMYITEDGIPMEKKYEHEEAEPLYPIYCFVDTDLSGTAEQGKNELNRLVGNRHGFDTVKPVQLIKYLIQTFADKNDYIMDFFAGSSTTAQACIEQNAEDKGYRKYILVQIPEKCDEDSEFKTICDIGKKRIINATKILNAKKSAKDVSPEQIRLSKNKEPTDLFASNDAHDKTDNYKLDIGFRVLKIDSTNMEDVYYTPDHIDTNDLFKNNIKADRIGEDLLFQTMLDLGIMLSSKIETKKINGKEVFCVEDNYLMACFDDSVDEKTITEIAKEKPYYFVMRDPANSKDGDSLITNFEQIFTTYSPDTVRKVL